MSDSDYDAYPLDDPKHPTNAGASEGLSDALIRSREEVEQELDDLAAGVIQPCPVCRGTGGYGRYNNCEACGGNGVI